MEHWFWPLFHGTVGGCTIWLGSWYWWNVGSWGRLVWLMELSCFQRASICVSMPCFIFPISARCWLKPCFMFSISFSKKSFGAVDLCWSLFIRFLVKGVRNASLLWLSTDVVLSLLNLGGLVSILDVPAVGRNLVVLCWRVSLSLSSSKCCLFVPTKCV